MSPLRCKRRHDFMFDQRINLPKLVRDKILELIRRPDVSSVSCPYDDPDLWRELIVVSVAVILTH